MRLHLLLSKVDPKAMAVPTKCAYADCKSLQVRLHQPVSKALRDTVHKPRRGTSLSLPEMSAHLSGLSRGSDPRPQLGSGQRASGDVVSVGPLLWSRLPGVRQLGRPALQDTGL
jgi:hypothetical protein